jgi:hypothetical protein
MSRRSDTQSSAALIEAGYFDLALTFNFDDLVEKALAGIGFSDFKRVIRGETIEDEMQSSSTRSSRASSSIKRTAASSRRTISCSTSTR